MALLKANIREDLRDSDEFAFGDRRKGDLSNTMYEPYVVQTHTQLPGETVRWEIEKVPKELQGLAEDIYRQTVASANCFCFVFCF